MANFLRKHLKLHVAIALIFSSPVYSAAMGIIGGQDQTGLQPGYSALVASDGTLTELSGGSFPSAAGRIFSVAINRGGAGIIGGRDLDATQRNRTPFL